VPVLTAILFLLTVLLFAPVTVWLVRQTLDHEQLTHALVILLLAAAALVIEERPRLAFYGKFDRMASGALLASFGLLAASMVFQSAWWVLPAFALALAGWGLFFFGPGVRRAVGSLAAAFIGYTVLAASVSALDWPLRAMAGRYAQWTLDKLGFFTGLGLVDRDGPRLILLVDGYPFEVAAECNGFGLLGAALLLAVLLAVYRPMPWVDRLLGLAVAVMLATLFNLLRIVTICILAPTFPNHYWPMHEVVGNLYFWACLALVWWMSWQGKAGKTKAESIK
jgi:exosortase/archaeosortase family protein